ncbi:isochorismatase family protein [Phaeacidiphilus oryzae]|uniref:isochorismatase family protein n=1 Tax=Phaeacidiphilus oryzae TaxID=348818 RepID=UPI000A0224F2|nr:isochorismatase family protein [Phaeacidiphilus oryzae]
MPQQAEPDPSAEIAATYRRAGFGAAVRRGRRPALIVVDLTRGFTEPGFATGADLTTEVAAAAELVEAAHAAGAPVVFTAIAYSEAELAGGVAWLEKSPGMRALREGDPAVELDPRLPYRPGADHLIVKNGASAYAGTGLAALLASLGCDTAVVCGATTSGCVRATAVDAVQSGLPVLVAAAAVGDRARPPHEAALFDLDAKYADLVGQSELLEYFAGTRAAQRLLGQRALADLADAPARSRWVRTGDGLRLHVLDYGPADGAGAPDHRPAALILPGITSPAVTFDFVARELTDLVRPLVLDVRGRGLSDAGAGYTLEDYARDTEEVIRRLGLERPLLVGHSMGARIAAATAARGRVPVAGSVLVDPPMSGPGGRGPYPTTLAAFLGQLDQARRGTDAEEVARSWPRWPRPEQELRARWLASCDREAIAATHRGFEEEDFFELWPSVPAPCALLYGEESPVVTAAGAAEAAAANPAARVAGVPGAGHMVFWDEPGAGLAALREALESVGKLAHG